MSIKDAVKNERIQQALDKSVPITVVEYEPDILGAITGQAELLCRAIPDISPQTMDLIYMITGGLSLKLSSLRYHSFKFKQYQSERAADIEADAELCASIKRGLLVCEKEMVFEFEAFFFQLKSSLDMLVKLFVPIFGSKQADISTYGKKGKDVIVHLQQIKKRKPFKNMPQGRIDWLIELIQDVKDPWLTPLIALRDTISHYRPSIGIGFRWDVEKNKINVPMANVSGTEYPLIEIMEKEAEQLIDYSREFVARTVLCGVPLNIQFQEMTAMEKRYFGALWGKDLSRALYNLSSNILYNYTEKDIEEARAGRSVQLQKL